MLTQFIFIVADYNKLEVLPKKKEKTRPNHSTVDEKYQGTDEIRKCELKMTRCELHWTNAS